MEHPFPFQMVSRGEGCREQSSEPSGKKEEPMCASCGCGIAEDKQGDERNINWSEIVAAAEANDISPTEVLQNMQKMAEQQQG
jgi:hypothetical protein